MISVAQIGTNPGDDWVPQSVEALARRATFHTDFTFDRQMLQLASGLTGDQETQRVVAKLRGVSVHLFRYSQPGLYNPAALETIGAQYSQRGWQHLSNAHSSTSGEHTGRTDVWVRLDHGNVEGMALLLSNPTNVDVVVVNGTLSPLDLMHLRGHFGIPRAQNNDFGGDHLTPDRR
ncbi:MAG TPA: hypothetical protein VFW25_01375 [Silvibacterium sp.]|nr:hypothetical protein [Silvibacterium sp.]